MSESSFRSLHALRIKGFAAPSALAELADLPVADVEAHLAGLSDAGHATFNVARGLWRLTPDGRTVHADSLAKDVAGAGVGDGFAAPYHTFLGLNTRFKDVCGVWQLKDGQPNDHSDAAYDDAAIAQLVVLNDDSQPVISQFGELYERFAPYARRLDETCRKVADGETKMFTGVMCGSYHDVWMELHEDLILTQGIDRAEEGSF
jgi:hypothetical protein